MNLDASEFIVLDSTSGDESDLIEEISKCETKNACGCQTRIKELENKVKELNQELSKHQVLIDKESKPPVQIIFSDNFTARKYQAKVEEFLQNLLQSSIPEDYPDEKDESSEISKPIRVFNGFCVDNYQSNQEQRKPLYQASESIDVFDGNNTPMKDIKKNIGLCFNCLGGHVIKDCPHPIDKNQVAINKANRSTTSSTSRYHLDEANLNRFKPGVISGRLQEALNISSHEIPPFIYNMRILGYPPGWLREAENEDSGLKLYHSRNDSSRKGHDDVCQPVHYDSSKIVDFPGFNVPVGHKVKDDYQRLGYPSMHKNDLKENMMKLLNTSARKPTPKRKHRSGEDHKSKRHKSSQDESDPIEIVIEDDTEDDVCIDQNQRHSCTSSEMKNVSDKDSQNDNPSHTKQNSRSHSPSVDDLELVRKRLLCQLQDDDDAASEDSSVTLGGGKKEVSGLSLSVESGSPSVASLSGFEKLPNLNKFAQGIEDHLPFENLENSVGTFNRMRKVITSVRNKVHSV